MILDGIMMNSGEILDSEDGRESDVMESMLAAVRTIKTMMILQGRMLGRKVFAMVNRMSCTLRPMVML